MDRIELLFFVLTLLLLITVVLLIGRFFQRMKKLDSKLTLLATARNIEREIPGREQKQVNSLSTGQMRIMMQMVRRYMEEEKPYLDPRFKTSKICDALKINRTYLSEVLKKETGERFENFVNAYRIVYAIELLTTDTHEKWLFTLDHYARKAGFSSKSTFNRAFKQFTDLHPSFLQRIFLEDDAAVKAFLRYFDRLGVVLNNFN